MRTAIIFICVFVVSGCAQIQALRDKNTSVSYVSKEISSADEEKIGGDMAKFLTSQLPAAKTTIYVEPSNTVVRSSLVHQLIENGFGIQETKFNQGAAVSLQYFVTHINNGLLVRMMYSDRVSSRFYGRSPDGALSPSGKIAVREATK